MDGYCYICPKAGTDCKLHKNCFVIKTAVQLDKPINLYQKCAAENGRDIMITIGKSQQCN